MDTTDPRLQAGLYVAVVGTLSALTLGLLYTVFTAGFPEAVEAFLADPAGTVQENPRGLLALAGIFTSLFLLVTAVVVGGVRYARLEGAGNRPR